MSHTDSAQQLTLEMRHSCNLTNVHPQRLHVSGRIDPNDKTQIIAHVSVTIKSSDCTF